MPDPELTLISTGRSAYSLYGHRGTILLNPDIDEGEV
jgi:hypothetical protein